MVRLARHLKVGTPEGISRPLTVLKINAALSRPGPGLCYHSGAGAVSDSGQRAWPGRHFCPPRPD